MDTTIKDIKAKIEKYINLDRASDDDIINFISDMVRVVTEDYTLGEYIERIKRINKR